MYSGMQYYIIELDTTGHMPVGNAMEKKSATTFFFPSARTFAMLKRETISCLTYILLEVFS